MLFGKLKLWLAGAALAVSIVIGAFFSGSINGKTSAKADMAKQAAESLRKARKIESEAASMSISDIRKRIDGRMRD